MASMRYAVLYRLFSFSPLSLSFTCLMLKHKLFHRSRRRMLVATIAAALSGFIFAPGFVAGTRLGWKNARIFFQNFESKKSKKLKAKVTPTPYQNPLLNSVSAAAVEKTKI